MLFCVRAGRMFGLKCPIILLCNILALKTILRENWSQIFPKILGECTCILFQINQPV